MANESITVTQSLDQVTVVSEGPVGLNAGGTIEGALNVKGNLTVGVDGTGHDVKFFGDTAGKYMQWDQSADKLFINGELEVNGSATTFNSTVITIDDPIFSLGGQQRTDALDDSKDRGIEFFYHDGAQKTGFMGYDDSADAFTFLTSATNSNEVFSGTAGNLVTGGITASGDVVISASNSRFEVIDTDSGLKNVLAAGDSLGAVGTYTNHPLHIRTRALDAIVIDTSQNVGIGTAAPTSSLHVKDGSIKVEGAGTTYGFVLQRAGDDTYELRNLGGGLTIFNSTDGRREMVFDGSGNVGIGTTAPALKLEVAGAKGADGVVNVADTASVAAGVGGAIDFYGVSQSTSRTLFGRIEAKKTNATAGDYGAGLALSTRVNGSGNVTERLTILEGGNVGIGTTSPSVPLEVAGIIKTSTSLVANSATVNQVTAATANGDITIKNNNGADLVRFTHAGNVGIGTTSPTSLLEIAGDLEISPTEPTINLNRNNGSYSWKIVNGAGGGNFPTSTFNIANNAGNPVITAIDSGNVGIGTTSPAALLHVSGAMGSGVDGPDKTGIRLTNTPNGQTWRVASGSGGVNHSYFTIARAGQFPALTIDGSDNVGIDVTNPSQKLEVGGEILSDGLRLNLSSTSQRALTSTGTNSIQIGDAGVERLRFKNAAGTSLDIDSSGRVGIGVAAPARKFHVNAGSVNEAARIESTDTEVALELKDSTGTATIKSRGDFRFDGSAGEIARMEAGGNVGIGTTNPVYDLTVAGNIGLTTGTTNSIFLNNGNVSVKGDSNNKLFLNALDEIRLSTASTERLRVESGGLVRVFGDLQVDGTTTTVNSTVVTIDDPVLTLDGDTAPSSDDNKDRGIEFRYYDGSAKVGFMGWDDSADAFTFLKDATNSSEVFSGTPARIVTGAITLGGNMNLLNNQIEKCSAILGSGATGDLSLKDGTGGAEFLRLDAGDDQTVASKDIRFQDNVKARFGSNSDGHLRHDDSDFFLQNDKGDLFINNLADGKDILLRSDDGSGGMATYLTIDGSATNIKVDKDMRFNDNVDAEFGSSGDFKVYHDGSNTYLEQTNAGTGNIIISNANDEADIVLQSDNGSGGVTPYLTIDGGNTRTNIHKDFQFTDNVKGKFGTSGDLEIFHDGTNSYVENKSAGGDLYIKNTDADEDVVFQVANAASGTENYIILDGSARTSVLHKTLRALDNINIQAGDDGDLRIFHNGNSNIANVTGDLVVSTSTAQRKIFMRAPDGSGGVTNYMTFDGFLGHTTLQKKIRAEDGVRAEFGSDGDLVIEHTGSNAQIGNLTGDFTITQLAAGADIRLAANDGSGSQTDYLRLDGSQADGTNTYTVFPDNSRIALGDSNDFQLFHNGSNTRLVQNTGELSIEQQATDQIITLQADNGSGGITPYLTINGGEERTILSKELKASDGVKISVGSSSDLSLIHESSNSEINNNVGNLTIQNKADACDIILSSDDGSGAVTPYLTIDGSATKIQADKDLCLSDGVYLYMGSDNDFDARHNGTDFQARCSTGDMNFIQADSDQDMVFQCDNGSGSPTPYITLDGSEEEVVFSKKIRSGVVIQSPSSSITPTNNGELVVEASTNSKITFKLKGTDGVVRSAIITLS